MGHAWPRPEDLTVDTWRTGLRRTRDGFKAIVSHAECVRQSGDVTRTEETLV